ncbi:MAG: hypothetical protein M3081_18060, partial [Gemmatimonadota bacterium]|nr:hypothetical protein [Gemmatimonadota bacterium]
LGHRQHLVAMLRTLWSQLSGLRAPTMESADESEVTGRIRTLCAEIKEQTSMRAQTMQASTRRRE